MFAFFLATFIALTIAAPAAQMTPTYLANHHNLQGRAGTDRLVFAHFMIGIVSNRRSATDYDEDMKRAKAYGIDAFALNIGTDDFTSQQLQYAYESAANNDMKVFLSFDFNWWDVGSASEVGQTAGIYAKLPGQLLVDGKAFVSSFAGDGLDVAAMKAAVGTDIHFVPNFDPEKSSSFDDADGALNWMGWPSDGANRAPSAAQNVTVQDGDQRYLNALGSKDYMAPVSPWFFTHYGPTVSYSKNWLFPSELLWFERWTEILSMNARFVEIITWNDYGESHYVGPLSSPHTDDGASQWVNDMPHDGWLDMAKPFIAAYKAGATSINDFITEDQLIYWYRPQLKASNCDATDTCMSGSEGGNYYIGRPNGHEQVADEVFVVTLLKSAGTVQVTSGGNTQTFEAAAGASAFTVQMGAGKQQFALLRDAQPVFEGTSPMDIADGCICGIYNFNAFVGVLPAMEVSALDAEGLSKFSDGLKVGTCSAQPTLQATSGSVATQPVVTATGSPKTTTQPATTTVVEMTTTTIPGNQPPPTSVVQSPPPVAHTWTVWTTTTVTPPPTSTTPSPFASMSPSTTIVWTTTTITPGLNGLSTTQTPFASVPQNTTNATTTTSAAAAVTTDCVAGHGAKNYAGLCAFGCSQGFCPSGPCTCTSTGIPTPSAVEDKLDGKPAPGLDESYAELCSFACSRGYCPPAACQPV